MTTQPTESGGKRSAGGGPSQVRKIAPIGRPCVQTEHEVVKPKQRRAIRIQEVTAKTGLGRSTIYAMQAAGKFPRSFKVSERVAVWYEDQVDGFLEARAAASRQSEAA